MNDDDSCKHLGCHGRRLLCADDCLHMWHPQGKGGALGKGISGLATLKANSGHSHRHTSDFFFFRSQTCKTKNEKEQTSGAHITAYLHFPCLGRIKDHLTIRFPKSKNTHAKYSGPNIRGHLYVSRKNTRVGRQAAQFSLAPILNFFPGLGPTG